MVDDNDNSPKFTSKNYVFRVREDSLPGLYVGSVTAIDNDIDKSSNGKISYMFETPKPTFRIDDVSGNWRIYFIVVLLFNFNKYYKFDEFVKW